MDVTTRNNGIYESKAKKALLTWIGVMDCSDIIATRRLQSMLSSSEILSIGFCRHGKWAIGALCIFPDKVIESSNERCSGFVETISGFLV